ncbi:MAG TPA: asparagine synthase (glutamine-hydrolyzing) [Chloroflexia bacterium]|nr:asparagine synthase (glutamine-hydrolyzing) [Chloroflexia bacterium]
MCGIVGIARRIGPIEANILQRMNDEMIYRGPDNGGIYIDQNEDLSIGLGNRRLSIQDLSEAGNQPMQNQSGSVHLVYNGELYNNIELRSDLERRGYLYHSKTDTETILHSYEAYGIESLKRFNGMFALALYDKQRGRLILARDRMGIKPLYYWCDGEQIIFASELKTLLIHPAIPREIDREALDLYLSLYYVPSPFSIIKGIKKLMPGQFVIFSKDNFNINSFWEPRLEPTSLNSYDEKQLINQTRTTLQDAVKRQMVADVPIGVLLSGGIDSTVVAGIAQQNTTDPILSFAAGYTDSTLDAEENSKFNNDDLKYAQLVSRKLGTIHHEIILDGKDLPELLPRFVSQLDEPVCESTSPAIYAISKLARESGTKVLLSGDAGDELFGGYEWYSGARRLELYEKIPALHVALKMLQYLPLSDLTHFKAQDLLKKIKQPYLHKYRLIYSLLNSSDRYSLFNSNYFNINRSSSGIWEQVIGQYINSNPQAEFAHLLSYTDLNLWVRELFNPRLDRISMMCSVEARVPFQDNNVVDFALNLPMYTKIKGSESKYLLRSAFRHLIPDSVLNRKKQAFVGSMNLWLQGGLRELVTDMLAPSQINRFGILNPQKAESLVKNVLVDKREELVPVVWMLLTLQLWCDSYLRQPNLSCVN